MRKAINLDGAKNVHFIGIGGVSMSGLAQVLKREGFIVGGSDDIASEATARLQELGIPVAIPNAAENISDDMDLVVYTAAVKQDNPEYRAAVAKGISIIERPELLGKILKGYDHAICIAGSHGKTTTTSLVADVALAAGLDPTNHVGGQMYSDGMNYRVGDSSYFVLESCEYSNSFHHWHPQVGVILNIDADHLDFFGSMENIIESFATFTANIRPGGTLIIRTDVPGFERVTRDLKNGVEIVTFGLGGVDARFWPRNVEYILGRPSFDVMDGDKFLARVTMELPGQYNMLNALACFAVACTLGVNPEVTARALGEAKGTKRRFEYKGSFDGIDIIDDYAHHPTEIQSCLKAARNCRDSGRIVCIFQPHTYTRTKNHLHDFAKSFSDADEVVLIPIFAAREPFDPTISSEMLADEIRGNGVSVNHAKNFCEAGNFLRKMLLPGDLLITMGAGDVYKVGETLLST